MNKFGNHLCWLLLALAWSFSAMSKAPEGPDNGAARLIDRLEREFVGSFPAKAAAQGTFREFSLVASESQWGILPPYRTDVWAYNGTIPGPVFRIQLGETIRVNFTNLLPQPTSVHWHGVRVPNAMDGVPGVTQQAIATGNTFIYEFTPKDAGTFWFHPHVRSAEQIERGLSGVLIVEHPHEPRYSRDLVLVLDDWLLRRDGKIYEAFVTRHDLAHDGRWGNVLTVNGQFQPSITAKAGERIRIRMINVANGRVFAPAFPDLSPEVIAVDGMLTARPFPLGRFPMAPGNRIDVDLVIPKTSPGKQFKIVDVFSEQGIPLAFLEIDPEKSTETPAFQSPRAGHFPDWVGAINAPVSHEYVLDAKRGGPYGIAWTIDGNAWPSGTGIELRSGRFSRLRLVNNSYRLHPMHLHGQFFRLLARDGNATFEPYWRDTVLIGPKESIDIGLVPLDTGDWANHCHILEHAEAGMMTVLKVR